MEYKDYYTILGVSRDADEQTIKSAYRRLARAYHPDVNSNKEAATEKFKEINEAYTVLSDPEKRKTYDAFDARYEQYQRTYPGARPSAQPSGPAASPAGNGGRGQQRTHTRTFSDDDFERIFRGFVWTYTTARNARSGSSSDYSEFFEALFGNLWGAAAAQPGSRSATEFRPGRDIQVDAQLTLEEAYRGATRLLNYSDGRRIEVTVPPGVHGGSRLRVRGQGERVFGRPRGDLYLRIQVQPHAVFTRAGDDLHVGVAVAYETAQRSGEVDVPTMERPVTLKIPAGTQNGQTFRLHGLGMPKLADASRHGDLIVAVQVQPPARPRQASASRAAPKANPSASTGAAARAAGKSAARQAAGLVLLAISLLALTVQFAAGGQPLWLAMAGLGLILAFVRSPLALAGGLAALLASLWLAFEAGLEAADVLRQGWLLLPLTVSLLLLRSWPKLSRR